MDVYNAAFEWTDTNKHWLVEVPIRVAAYVVIALIARYLIHRAIDRATTGRRPKIVDEAQPTADESQTKKPPLLRNLRERAGSNTAKIAARRQQRAQTIGSVLKSTVSIVLLVWVVLTILNVFGVNIAPFIASAGVVGLAIGFGAQNLVRDFVTGVFMLLEDQYGVGDTVDLGEATGEVESVGLRITTVRDIDGTLWYVRNGEIARVGNMSQDYAVARVEVPVALSVDLSRAERVALEAAEQTIKDPAVAAKVIGEPEMLGVQELSPDRVTLRMTIKTRPNAQWSVQRRLRREILKAYDEHDIDLPYPTGRVPVAVGEQAGE
ncbi:mechanosensitive ion channel family protein [Mycobacterium sp. AMU20-3851]|uniref:mechanosensitive ion channel family protein n=1 Tax=Mycobacterium sp. AMU20-3851 TaxID=3122055 RepID=UPI003755086E